MLLVLLGIYAISELWKVLMNSTCLQESKGGNTSCSIRKNIPLDPSICYLFPDSIVPFTVDECNDKCLV